jgi:hypothetical protein
MFDFQLWEALETYLKWFAENDWPLSVLPLTAQLVLIYQRSILLVFAALSVYYSLQISNAFLIRLTNMLRLYHSFMRTQQRGKKTGKQMKLRGRRNG